MALPANSPDVIRAAYPLAVSGEEYIFSQLPDGLELSFWNVPGEPKPSDQQIIDWGNDAVLLPSGTIGNIFTGWKAAKQNIEDTNRLYDEGMPYTHPTDGKVYALITNGERISGRVDVNDVHQGRQSGERSAPYYFLDIILLPHLISTDEDHQAFWSAHNDHVTAIIGTFSQLRERTTALQVNQTAEANQIIADSQSRDADNVVESFYTWLPGSQLGTLALGQVERKNAALEDSSLEINGDRVRRRELEALQSWVLSGEDDYPYHLPVIEDDPKVINNEQQARNVIRRFGERKREVRKDGRRFIQRMRRAIADGDKQALRIEMAANAVR